MILITGAGGFIGQRLTRDLLAAGHPVRVVARDREKARRLFPGADVRRADILDAGSLARAASDVTQVVHLAGLISYTCPPAELFQVNVEGTRNVLRACRRADKILFASSTAIYGQTVGKATEATPPAPLTAYGASKLAAEQAVLASGMPALCYRLGPVFGAGSPLWQEILRFFSKGFPLPASRSVVNLIHVSDVSRAFLPGLKRGRGVYNIAGDHALPFRELAMTLSAALGIRARFWPAWLVVFLARFRGREKELQAFITNRDFDISKARRELGFNPRADVEAELQRMAAWFLASSRRPVS